MNWISQQKGQWMKILQFVPPYSTSSIPCMELLGTRLYRCLLSDEKKTKEKCEELFPAMKKMNAMVDTK